MASVPEDSSRQAPDNDEQLQPEPDLPRPEVQALLKKYWHTNLLITALLLAIWAAAGLGCAVVLGKVLNHYKLPGTGYPLGFWFAQQGSIIAFILLILSYCIFMSRLDARHHKELKRLNGEKGPSR